MTPDEAKALRKGDVILIRATVDCVDERLIYAYPGENTAKVSARHELCSLAERGPFVEGDPVIVMSGLNTNDRGRIIKIDDGIAWVKFAPEVGGRANRLQPLSNLAYDDKPPKAKPAQDPSRKDVCRDCHGSGLVADDDGRLSQNCTNCDGSGLVPWSKPAGA